MAITVGGMSVAGGTGPLSLTKPSGLADGDIILAFMCVNLASATFTPPTGWTLRASGTWIGTGKPWAMYYHVVSSAASEPSSYSFAMNTTFTNFQVMIVAYSGVDTTTVFGNSSDGIGSTSGSVSSVVVPGITTTVASATLVSFYCSFNRKNEGFTITPPSGMTREWEADATHYTAIADQAFPTAGSTGTRTWSTVANSYLGAVLTSLNPASGGTGAALAGTSAGTSSASATGLRLSQPLAGSSAGTSTASATRLSLSQPLAGTSAGTSSATATGLRLSQPLAGISTGTSSSTGTLVNPAGTVRPEGMVTFDFTMRFT